jgi:hypothetical protein
LNSRKVSYCRLRGVSRCGHLVAIPGTDGKEEGFAVSGCPGSLFCHQLAKSLINSCLITPPAALEPGQHIGIQPQGNWPFDGFVHGRIADPGGSPQPSPRTAGLLCSYCLVSRGLLSFPARPLLHTTSRFLECTYSATRNTSSALMMTERSFEWLRFQRFHADDTIS